MSLLQEITLFGEAYMEGKITYETYVWLVGMAIECYKMTGIDLGGEVIVRQYSN